MLFFADVKRRKVDVPSDSKVSIESFWMGCRRGRAGCTATVSALFHFGQFLLLANVLLPWAASSMFVIGRVFHLMSLAAV